MTFKEALKIEKKWYRRVFIINLYHNSMILKRRKWNQRLTAKKLNISLGAVSEAIKLAKAILESPELEEMNRKDALDKIR